MIGLDPTQYRAVLVLAGLAFVLAAWVPAYTKHRPLSVPMVLVAVGVLLSAVPGMFDVRPREHLPVAEHLTEFGVIIALLGAGLKLDRRPGWRSWALTWRLLGISMVITIGATALIGWAFVGLAPATAILLGAALAPTDPVLAAEVQVGEPSVESDGAEDDTEPEPEDDVRFSLTSEAGLNDGLAFPFVHAAIAVATSASAVSWMPRWFGVDVGWRITVGVALGWLTGKVLGRVSFRPPGRLVALADAGNGFVALAATFLAYGLTELAHGYGFLAVFVAALGLRDSERGHHYHRVLHDFAGQVEEVVVTVLLVLLGMAAADLLAALTWQGAITGLLLILVVRPVAGRVGLATAPVSDADRRAISFFGIRGVGSFYYIAFAVSRADFEHADELWAIVAFTVLASIVIHGVTATPVMELLDRRRRRRWAAAAATRPLKGTTR